MEEKTKDELANTASEENTDILKTLEKVWKRQALQQGVGIEEAFRQVKGLML
ncbi:MAG: hypothetical protein QM426_08210 [Euryarchaeota archaeon]|nr:hypothetical protein [Euryarchaeota archaeon]